MKLVVIDIGGTFGEGVSAQYKDMVLSQEHNRESAFLNELCLLHPLDCGNLVRIAIPKEAIYTIIKVNGKEAILCFYQGKWSIEEWEDEDELTEDY